MIRYKQSQHEYIGGEVPYGWKISPDGVHVEPNAAEQEVIQQAHALKAQGFSLRKIGEALAQKGILPRKGRWHATTVQHLLNAERAA